MVIYLTTSDVRNFILTPAAVNPFASKISLVILFTVSHTILVMLVLRIWYWINSQVPGEELKVTSDELLYSLSKFSYIPFRNRGRSKCWNSNKKSLRVLFWKTISHFFHLMYFGFSSVWKKKFPWLPLTFSTMWYSFGTWGPCETLEVICRNKINLCFIKTAI